MSGSDSSGAGAAPGVGRTAERRAGGPAEDLDGTARIMLSAAMPGVAFSVTDGTFQVVARAVGKLDVEVPQGLYEIATRAGGSVETQLISLAPGEVWRREGVTAGLYAAAPLAGSLTESPVHAEATSAASRKVAGAGGPSAGLVVVVRRFDAPGQELHHEQLLLLDRDLRPVPDVLSWTVDAASGVATAGARLEPGAYVLRLRQPAAHGPALDQALWLSEGWQTLVFCPNGAERVAVEDSTVHMCWLPEAFPGVHTGLATAVEIAMSGLRQGLPLVNADLLEVLRGQEFANPMLGIAGAHALLLRPDGDLGDYCAVVSELRELLPDHPDVVALATKPECRSTGLPPVWWPPMLAASYDKLLLRADRVNPAVIEDGSPAERVAGYVVQRGPWLSWEATRAVLRPAPQPTVVHGQTAEPGTTQILTATTAGATRRVQRHVQELAGLTGSSQHQVAGSLGADELARRLDLPIQTVRAVLTELGWDTIVLPPPPVPKPEPLLIPEPQPEPGPGPAPWPRPEPVQVGWRARLRAWARSVMGSGPRSQVRLAGPATATVESRNRRRWWLGGGLVIAGAVAVAGSPALFNGGVGEAAVTLSVRHQPGVFARTTPSVRTVEVGLTGNDTAQKITVRVEGDGFTADGTACEQVKAGGSCEIPVSYRPDRRRLRDHRATLVLSSPDAKEVRVPLYGAAKAAEGDISVAWRQVRDVRVGESFTPYVEVNNVKLGPVQTVLAITIPSGFDLGTFADQCDTRRVRVVYCWVGLDEHHTVWPINVPLIARSGTGGTLRVTAQVSVDREHPDDDQADNTATATVRITGR